MEKEKIVALISLALGLVENLLPHLKALKLSGQITTEQQQEVLDRYASLKAKGDSAFSGPEWKIQE